MSYVGNEKGQLETNSTVTSYRVRCKQVDCEAAEVFKPQSMTLVQQALSQLGWSYTPGPLEDDAPTPGHWACPKCTAVEEATTESTESTEGEGSTTENTESTEPLAAGKEAVAKDAESMKGPG